MSHLKDKTIIIIGGSSGMGLATALRVLKQGAKVHIVGRSVDKLRNAQRDLQTFATNIMTHCADLCDEAGLADLFADIGPFDHLVLSASGAKLDSEEIRTENLTVLKNAFDSKIWGYIYAVKYATSYLCKTGSITLFSGGFSVRPGHNTPISTTVNIAIEGLTQALAKSLAPIRINAIRPGLIHTPLTDILITSGHSEALVNKLPLCRVGQADEVAKGICYLLDNQYVTGTVLTIDGGYIIH